MRPTLFTVGFQNNEKTMEHSDQWIITGRHVLDAQAIFFWRTTIIRHQSIVECKQIKH